MKITPVAGALIGASLGTLFAVLVTRAAVAQWPDVRAEWVAPLGYLLGVGGASIGLVIAAQARAILEARARHQVHTEDVRRRIESQIRGGGRISGDRDSSDRVRLALRNLTEEIAKPSPYGARKRVQGEDGK